MKKIETQGITYLEPLSGNRDWYWGTDYIHGDLYEAEELFLSGHPVSRNKLVFVHYPDGKTVQPVLAEPGQYLGRPIFYENKIMILLVDFPAGKIHIIAYDDTSGQAEPLKELPRSIAKDCYNLMLARPPLMLTRQASDDTFEILWPETVRFKVGNAESFAFRAGEKLYFSAWHDEPAYREEIIVRDMRTGKILDRIPGGLMTMPDGQMWVLK